MDSRLKKIRRGPIYRRSGKRKFRGLLRPVLMWLTRGFSQTGQRHPVKPPRAY